VIVPAVASSQASSSTGAVVGGVVGAVAGCVLIVLVAILLLQRRKQNSANLQLERMLGPQTQETISLYFCL
jgi:hypothetical protein